MKAATWNVNSINSRLERLQAFLKRHSPDLVCLQELKCTDDKFPFKEIEDCGYSAAVFGQKTYNGVALLSKSPLKDIQMGFADGAQDPAARFIGGTLAETRFYSVYVPNGQEVGSEKYLYKLDWFKRLTRYFEKHHKKDERILVSGDFNVAPQDTDVHDPELWRGQILCSGRERSSLANFCEWGFKDVFRELYPEDKQYSWWDYRQLAFPKNNGLRIDLILASNSLAKLCTKSWIDREERKGEKPSDHAPVLAEFK